MKYVIVCFGLFISCNNRKIKDELSNTSDKSNNLIGLLNYDVVKVYPHDTAAFTEGLLFFNNHLYESTGLEGKSSIREFDIANNELIRQYKLPDVKQFGEGITILNNKIFQLTWKNHVAYVYDVTTLSQETKHTWPYEGWGITNNAESLIISTGSSILYFVNPSSFKIEKQINVKNNFGFVANINELEYIKGYIFANVWREEYILKINPANGEVEGKIDLSEVLKKLGITYNEMKTDVLNGIAYNPQNNHLFVTGKYWPVLLEIALK